MSMDRNSGPPPEVTCLKCGHRAEMCEHFQLVMGSPFDADRWHEPTVAERGYLEMIASQGGALGRIGRKLDLARLTERYENDKGFASFIDDLITDVMEGSERG